MIGSKLFYVLLGCTILISWIVSFVMYRVCVTVNDKSYAIKLVSVYRKLQCFCIFVLIAFPKLLFLLNDLKIIESLMICFYVFCVYQIIPLGVYVKKLRNSF